MAACSIECPAGQGLKDMQRLKTRAQFQAAMSGGIVSRTAHFALHRLVLDAAQAAAEPPISGPGSLPSVQGPQALFSVPGQPDVTVWLGPLVPKRWAKRSVTRHAIKRQIYAVGQSYASQLHTLPKAAYVVRLKSGFDAKQFVSACSEPLKAAVRKEIQQLFGYAVRKASATPSGHHPAQPSAAPQSAAPESVA